MKNERIKIREDLVTRRVQIEFVVFQSLDKKISAKNIFKQRNKCRGVEEWGEITCEDENRHQFKITYWLILC